MAFLYLPELLPSIHEPCWFMVLPESPEIAPIFETTPEVAIQIMGECSFFEYCLIAKDMRWLLCESHHSVVYGIGQEVIDAIGRARTRLELEKQTKRSE
jgi:hypothetical protein